MSAETCARADATQILARHGSGSILVTDQGRSFTSAFFKETCKILGIQQMHSSAYNPRGNGTIERLHKTMNQGSSHYVNSSGTDWDTLIPFYMMAYRGTPHGTHGFSPFFCYMAEKWRTEGHHMEPRVQPFFLLHGREMVLPTSQGLKATLTAEVRETDYVHRLEKLKSTLQRAYKTVREQSQVPRHKQTVL
jgi:transposase InsO family protein